MLQGELDQLLIRPLSLLALLLTRNLELGRIGGIVQGLAVFGVAVAGLHAQGKPVWDVVLYAPVALLAGSSIFFALSLATATLCFWTHQTKDLRRLPSTPRPTRPTIPSVFIRGG